MRKLARILNGALGEGRTAAEKRTDDYQAAEGMTEPASTRPAKDPPKKAPKSDSSVIMPTPSGGAGCPLVLAKLATLLAAPAVGLALLAGCDQNNNPPTTDWCQSSTGQVCVAGEA